MRTRKQEVAEWRLRVITTPKLMQAVAQAFANTLKHFIFVINI